MKLSLCITTYNRYLLTVESFAKVLEDPRIDDIVILDDASTDLSGVQLHALFANNPKVRVIRQTRNRGMSMNKRDAIAYARNEWAIIFDSDNIIGLDYLDAFGAYTGYFEALLNVEDVNKFIFCPDFAQPKFDYRQFNSSSKGGDKNFRSGIYAAHECAKEIADSDFNCLMNTCNYIVNRDFYLKVYQHNPEHIASDTIWHNYNHLIAGGHFCVVPGMQYFHRVHKGSGFMQGVDNNIAQAEKVRRLIQQL